MVVPQRIAGIVTVRGNPRQLAIDETVPGRLGPQREQLRLRFDEPVRRHQRFGQLQPVFAAVARVLLRGAEIVGGVCSLCPPPDRSALARPAAGERLAAVPGAVDQPVGDDEGRNGAEDRDRENDPATADGVS